MNLKKLKGDDGMTENKRFKAIGKEIWQDNRIWCVCGGEHCADVIATAMNELLEEKQAIFDRIMKEIHFNDKQYVETKDKCFKYTSIALSNILRQFGVI